MSEYKITVNTYADSSHETRSWNIREKTDEPERISIQKGNRVYSVVFDTPVRFEVWSVGEDGELADRMEFLKAKPDIQPFNFDELDAKLTELFNRGRTS